MICFPDVQLSICVSKAHTVHKPLRPYNFYKWEQFTVCSLSAGLSYSPKGLLSLTCALGADSGVAPSNFESWDSKQGQRVVLSSTQDFTCICHPCTNWALCPLCPSGIQILHSSSKYTTFCCVWRDELVNAFHYKPQTFLSLPFILWIDIGKIIQLKLCSGLSEFKKLLPPQNNARPQKM